MFGLTDDDLQFIVNVIKSYPQVTEAVIFGSRALNTYKTGSDIDIALKGEQLEDIVATISGTLNEEAPFPYFCDVLDYHQIDHADLKSHIDRVGRPIYKIQKMYN